MKPTRRAAGQGAGPGAGGARAHPHRHPRRDGGGRTWSASPSWSRRPPPCHAQGVTKIESSSPGAEALRPAAGPWRSPCSRSASSAPGLLAVPVLAGSAAYAVGEALEWPVGTRPASPVGGPAPSTPRWPRHARRRRRQLHRDRPDLGARAGALSSTGSSASRSWPSMVRLASRPKIMGEHAIGTGLRIGAWTATAVLAACVLATGASALLG